MEAMVGILFLFAIVLAIMWWHEPGGKIWWLLRGGAVRRGDYKKSRDRTNGQL